MAANLYQPAEVLTFHPPVMLALARARGTAGPGHLMPPLPVMARLDRAIWSGTGDRRNGNFADCNK